MTLQFKSNINCNNCVKSVSPHLNELDLIDEWKVDLDHENRILTVVVDEDEVGGNNPVDTVKKAISAAGFSVEEI